MTVTIPTKHELAERADDEDEDANGTCCCMEKNISCSDHTNSLLENLAVVEKPNFNTKEDVKKVFERNEPFDYQDRLAEEKARRLLTFHEAPIYLRHNVYILTGYRGILNTKLCLESMFWWTNETINIWSHIFGFFLFFGLALHDLLVIEVHVPTGDKFLVALVLLCFQVCMVMSSLYHTFTCRSEKDARCFLMYDLFGIALSLYAIYISGIYYAFWCERAWQPFYLLTVTIFFAIAMALQHPKMKANENFKMFVFVLWAAYGVIPTLHWSIWMGGLEHPLVKLLVPRVLGMYVISGVAFAIYLMKIPERFYAGKFDFLGHSHQWWHIIIVFALYYWHSSGIMYLEYRMQHACNVNLRIA